MLLRIIAEWVGRTCGKVRIHFKHSIQENLYILRFFFYFYNVGVSGSWVGAWLIVSSRRLYYAKDDAPMCTVDLRKARCIQLQDPDADSPKTTDKGPNLLVDSQEGTLYLRMWTARETKVK